MVGDERGRVTLMTVHGSKGLEFGTVFLVGMEDELFPSIRDPNDTEELEEERRLAYVAITRAKQRLFVSNTKGRRVYGTLKENTPSRFLLDIDPARIEIDAKSVVDAIDWRPARLKRRPPTDEELYFSEGKAAQAAFDFNQEAPSVVGGEHTSHYDEFSQVAPSEWEDGFGGSAPMSTSKRRRSEENEKLVGCTVTHTRYGIGEVREVSGRGSMASVTVDFPTAGAKTIVRKFLKVIG